MALTTEQSTYLSQLTAACSAFTTALEAAMLADNDGTGTVNDARDLAYDSMVAFAKVAFHLGYFNLGPTGVSDAEMLQRLLTPIQPLAFVNAYSNPQSLTSASGSFPGGYYLKAGATPRTV